MREGEIGEIVRVNRERGGIGNGIRRIKCDTVQICLRENDARHWSEA